MIVFDRVRFAYQHGGEPVIVDATFALSAGERLAVIGRSGSGKSTLGRLCAGLLTPSSGVIERGRRGTVSTRNPVAMVFQNPETQFVAHIVEDDVAFGPENLGLDTAVIRRRVDDALEAVGIQHLQYRPIASLSGGEQQRVALAGALAMEPDCIVLDEASSMLHPRGRASLEQAIDRIRRRRSLGVIQMTHDLDEAARADRVLLLNHGRIEALAPPKMVLGDPTLLKQCGIAPPPAAVIAEALKARGWPIENRPITVDALADAVIEAVGR